MNDTIRGHQAKIRELDNKIKRIRNGEIILRFPEKVSKLLAYRIMQEEELIFANSIQ